MPESFRTKLERWGFNWFPAYRATDPNRDCTFKIAPPAAESPAGEAQVS